MIAALSGTLKVRGLDRVVVDVGGVGYLVHVSLQTLGTLPAAGGRVELLCHTHVREEALQLFGFASGDEQVAFERLIAVQGVGPRLAMTILSGIPVAELARAISGGDHRRLQAVPGVGKKTAERLVLELKEKLADLARGGAGAPGGSGAAAEPDLVEALVGLGYKRAQADRAARLARDRLGDGEPADALLRAALAAMAEL